MASGESAESAIADDQLRSLMDPGETVVAAGWAEVSMPHQGPKTVVPVGLLLRLAYLFADRRRIAKLREGSAEAGFPLDRHMWMALTSERLFIWSASRHPQKRRSLLGDVPRGSIRSVELAYPQPLPLPTRTVALETDAGLRVTFRADGALAETLVREL